MKDTQTTVQELKALMAAFVKERDWNQFHSPKNLSMAIAAEAAELMEKFLWMDMAAAHKEVDRNRKDIEDELADVITAALMFANAANIDVSSAVMRKLAKTAEKYPIEKAKGVYTKYTEL